jgi:Protein of unknown function (DUF3179)
MWIRSAFRALTSTSRTQWFVGLLVAVVVGGVALYVTRAPVSGPALAPSQSPDPLDSSEIKGILPVDAIRAIDQPQFVAADKAGMRENLSIIGVGLGGEAHAFPIAIMSHVEIVNDRLGGKNIAVTW